MIIWLCPQFGGLFSGWLRLLSKVGVIEIDVAFTVSLMPLLNFSKLLILASRKMHYLKKPEGIMDAAAALGAPELPFTRLFPHLLDGARADVGRLAQAVVHGKLGRR